MENPPWEDTLIIGMRDLQWKHQVEQTLKDKVTKLANSIQADQLHSEQIRKLIEETTIGITEYSGCTGHQNI